MEKIKSRKAHALPAFRSTAVVVIRETAVIPPLIGERFERLYSGFAPPLEVRYKFHPQVEQRSKPAFA